MPGAAHDQPYLFSVHLLHRLTAQLCAAVDGDPVPVPHWGMALRVDQFHALAERVRTSGIRFEIEPHLRFKGAPQSHGRVLGDSVNLAPPSTL